MESRIALRCSSGDGPAVFVIMLAGLIVVACALAVEVRYEPPLWVHALLWGPLILATTLLPLRPLILGMSTYALAIITGSTIAMVDIGAGLRLGGEPQWWMWVTIAALSVMKFDWIFVPAKKLSSTFALSKPDIGPTSKPSARAAMIRYAPCRDELRKAELAISASLPANHALAST